MAYMWSDALWRGGRLTSAVRLGVPSGALFGLIQYAAFGSASTALVQAILFAAIFGAAMSLVMWRKWPGASELQPVDRVTVARIVRRGGDVGDPRLAPAVLDYVALVRRARDSDRRFSWVLWVFLGGTLILALVASFGGEVRSAVVWWVLVVFWAFYVVWLPRKRVRVLGNAERAESAAQSALRRRPIQ